MEQALIEQVNKLLQSTGTILEKHEEIARLRGENFNVFHLLGIETKEDVHSRLIAELLNPEGSHDQKTAFLEMFLKQVGDTLPSNRFPKKSKAKAHREYDIGRMHIDGEKSTGGRIDIFITDGKRHISIENKIDADEQEYQTTRYCNYKPKSNLVLFLTLRGDKASTNRAYPISYKNHILPWLESCHKHCADLPILRETIKQYIIIIKRLTGGLTMQKMDEKIKQLMREDIEAAHEIYSNYEPIVKEIIIEFVQEVKEKIEREDPVARNSDDWELQIYNEKTMGGLKIKNKKWRDLRKKEDENFHLQIEIQGRYKNKELYYGVVAHRDYFDRDKIKEELAEIEEYGIKFYLKDEYWPFWTYVDDRNFLNPAGIKKLLNEEERTKLVKNIADKLIELIAFCNGRLLPNCVSQWDSRK